MFVQSDDARRASHAAHLCAVNLVGRHHDLATEEIAFRDEERVSLEHELTPELRAAGRRCSGIFTGYGDGIRRHGASSLQSGLHWLRTFEIKLDPRIVEFDDPGRR